MKKFLKAALAIMLCFVMLIGVMPMGVFAEDTDDSKVTADSDTAVSGTSGMELILNNLDETNTDENNSGCSVSRCNITGKNAYVEFVASKDCILVVAIYDDSTKQMLASGIKDVAAEDTSATVTIDIAAMPAYYLVKVYMLNDDRSPLSSSFSFFEHTTAYEKFMSVTPEDFEEDRVIEFDDNTEENFGALSEDVIIPETNDSMQVDYDSDSGVYTFKNAVDEIKKLRVGDSLYYEIECDDVIILKVAEISVSGNIVSIKEDTEIGLDDVFDYIRYDEGIDADDYNPEDVDCGEYSEMTDFQVYNAEEYNFMEGIDGELVTQSSEDVGDEGSDIKGQIISTKFSINFVDTKSKNEAFSAKVTGSIGITIGASARLHWDVEIGPDYFEYKVEIEAKTELELSVTGSVEIPKDKVCWQIDGKDKNGNPKGFKLDKLGIFRLYAKVYPVVSLEAEIDLIKITILNEKGIIINSTDGYNKTSNESKWIDGDFLEIEITLKIGVGLEIEVGRKVGKKDEHGDQEIMATVSITVEVYWKGTLSPDNIGINPKHNCKFCLSGTSDFCVDGNIKVKLKIYKLLTKIEKKNKKIGKFIDKNGKLEITALSLSYEKDLGKCYAGVDGNGKFQFGFGVCPNIKTTITIYVYDSANNKAIKDATVTCSGSTVQTDDSGNAVFYLKAGTTYTFTITYDSITQTRRVDVSEAEKTIQVNFDGKNAPQEPDDPSDGTGSDDYVPANVTTGSIIRFGSYPQSKVTDTTLISKLDSASKSWQSYEYYSGTGDWDDGQMTSSDYMQYADFKYGNAKYRAVKFSEYRPYCTGYTSSASNTYQDDNGYTTGNTYYFKYEPIEWRVLDPSSGLVMCATAIDSQAYNNYIWLGVGSKNTSSEYYGDKAHTKYASDYANSSIREWLNNDFYNTAFSSEQQGKIQLTQNLDNSSTYSSTYDSATTNDKIYLLSYDDTINSNYGFNSNNSAYDTARQLKSSDYAKCQGCSSYEGSSYLGNCWWWLRSPYCSSYARGISSDGNGDYFNDVDFTYRGVVPALKIQNLTSLSTQSNVTTQAKGEGTALSFSYSDCEAVGEYILLNVTDYGNNFTLTTQNLEFIDQLTADENGKVSGSFIPRNYYSNSTTLLIGNFGNGIEAKTLNTINQQEEPDEPDVIPDIKIANYKSSISVDYKSALTFHTDIDAPTGYKIVWNNGQEGKACTLSSVTNSEYKVSAKLVRISDNKTVKETQVETVTVNTGFFAKIIAFFKGLFKSLPVYIDNNKQ